MLDKEMAEGERLKVDKREEVLVGKVEIIRRLVEELEEGVRLRLL